MELGTGENDLDIVQCHDNAVMFVRAESQERKLLMQVAADFENFLLGQLQQLADCHGLHGCLPWSLRLRPPQSSWVAGDTGRMGAASLATET